MKKKPIIYLVQFHTQILVDWPHRAKRYGEASESEMMFDHLWDDTDRNCHIDNLDWIKFLAASHGWEVSFRVPSKKEMWDHTDSGDC